MQAQMLVSGEIEGRGEICVHWSSIGEWQGRGPHNSVCTDQIVVSGKVEGNTTLRTLVRTGRSREHQCHSPRAWCSQVYVPANGGSSAR
jgi:hypothetical protein